MIDLKRLDIKKELAHYNTNDFTLESQEHFSINEQDEKIWASEYTYNKETYTIMFQVVVENQTIHLGFSSDVYIEPIRLKASELLHDLKERLQNQFPNCLVKLDEIVISNFEAYRKHVENDELDLLEKEVIFYLHEAKTYLNREEVNEQNRIIIYGNDGAVLGHILEKTGEAVFTKHEDGIHSLTFISSDMKCNTTAQKQFIKSMKELGFGLTQEVSYENLSENTFESLLGSGLFNID